MSHRSITIATAVALVLGAAGGARAADKAAVPSTALEEVVVTATKRQEKLKEVPMAISAVTGEDLIRRNETNILDWAAQVPGLSLEVANPGLLRIVIRGANFGSVGATVATVVDDIPFSMTGSQANGAFFGANVDTYDLQRIEVLRGPQGTLYGATAEGGLIKYVTNLPDLERFAGDIGIGGESVAGGSSKLRMRGMFNMPLIDGKLGLRLSVVKDNRPGWIDNNGLGVKDWNDIEKTNVRASLLWQPTERLSARLQYFQQEQDAAGDNTVRVVGSVFTAANPPADKFDKVDGMSIISGTPINTVNELRTYGLNVQYDFDAFSLMSSTSYGEIENRFVRDLSLGNIQPGVTIADFFGAVIYRQPIRIVGNQSEALQKFNQELRISSKPGAQLGSVGLDWQGGLFFTHEVVTFIQPYDALGANGQPLAPPLGAGRINSGLKEKAAFADFTLRFTDRFDIGFGARYSQNEQYNQLKNSCCIVFGPGGDERKLRSDESTTTYSFAPRYKFADGTVLYARYATGYRAGGPNLPVPGFPNPPPLKSDSTKNYEVGLRSDLFDNRVSVDFAVFRIDWKDAQVLTIVQTPNGAFGINGNAGTATSKGLEWNIGFRPTDDLLIGFVGAYTDAKVTQDALGIGAKKGQDLPFVPDLQATLNVDWTLGRFGGFDTTLGGSYTQTSERRTNFSTSTVFESYVKLPSYNTAKLQLGIDNGKFNAQVYVNNLTDEYAVVNYSGSGGFGQKGLVGTIQPRTYGVSAGYRF